jgi:hypothetical protein
MARKQRQLDGRVGLSAETGSNFGLAILGLSDHQITSLTATHKTTELLQQALRQNHFAVICQPIIGKEGHYLSILCVEMQPDAFPSDLIKLAKSPDSAT